MSVAMSGVSILASTTDFHNVTTDIAVNATESTTINDDKEEWFREIVTAIRWCFIPIVAVGTVTNTLNIIVFSSGKMLHQSTVNFLLALAIADFGLMYFELFRIWFEWVDFVDPASYFSDAYCKMANYLDVSCIDFSNWIIAAITAERLFVLSFPLKARTMCTLKNTRRVIAVLFLFVFGARIHHIVLTKAQLVSGGWVCWGVYPNQWAKDAELVVESVVGYLVIFLVFLENIVLMILLATRTQIQSSKDDSQKLQIQKLTQMLLAVGILFLVCESPRAIMPIYHRFYPRTYTSRILHNTTYVLSGIDHASNFFIYVMRGEKFREVLFDKIPCCRTVCCAKEKAPKFDTGSTGSMSVSAISA